MNRVIPALLAVLAIGIGTTAAHATVNHDDMWSTVSYVDPNYITAEYWVWNPNNHNITHANPAKTTPLNITEVGTWDVLTTDFVEDGTQYRLNGEIFTRSAAPGHYLMPLIWLEEQVGKIWKYLKLHDTQMNNLQKTDADLKKQNDNLQKQITQLQKKASSQADRITDLEDAIKKLAEQPTNQPNTPS